MSAFSKYTTNEATSKAIIEIQAFKKTIEEQTRIIELLQKQLEEKDSEIENTKKDADERVAQAERLKEEAEKKRKEAEKNLDAQIQKNKYLQATQNTSKEVRDLMHVILISSNDAISVIKTAKNQWENNNIHDLRTSLDELEYHTGKINKLSKLITKADLTLLAQSNLVDIQTFIEEYFANYKDLKIQYYSTIVEPLEKKIPVLDLSIVLDNLKSNSDKAGATEIRVDFSIDGRTYIVDFTDNGKGVDLNTFTSESIFEEGITNRRGGSGIGLSTIRERMKDSINGNIEFVGNGLYFDTGATFRLTFK